jgi:hypothetical protein
MRANERRRKSHRAKGFDLLTYVHDENDDDEKVEGEPWASK